MSQATISSSCWHSADLALQKTDEWKRYEMIDGELCVTPAPHFGHQNAAGRIYARLLSWSDETGAGQPIFSPGLIFTEADRVIPDVVWMSKARLAASINDCGHLMSAPQLVVEVLSAEQANEQRDREIKLQLYALNGVQEYWIVNWRLRQVEVYRRHGAQLCAIATLLVGDAIASPLLRGFQCNVEHFFSA